MKRIHLLTIVACVAIAGSAFAAEVDLSQLPPPSDKKGLTFEKDIKPLFAASCVSCHGGERPSRNLSLESLEGALKGGRNAHDITPGDSKNSPMVAMIARLPGATAMPPPPRGRGRGGPGMGGPGGTNNPPGGPGGGPPPPGGGPGGPGGMGGGPGGPGGRGPAGPPPKPLTTEEVSLIRAWIDQGAK